MRPQRHDDHIRVYLRYARHGSSWRCEFLLDGSQRPLPRVLTFSDDHKITELAERGDGLPNLECRQALESGIRAGRGGVFLRLTPDQLAKLR